MSDGHHDDGIFTLAFAALIVVVVVFLVASYQFSRNIGANFGITLTAVWHSVLCCVVAVVIGYGLRFFRGEFNWSTVGASSSIACLMIWWCWWKVFASISCGGCDATSQSEGGMPWQDSHWGGSEGGSFLLDNTYLEYGVAAGLLVLSVVFLFKSLSD